MARVTVQDCLDHVDNRFELVMLASKRARQLVIEGKDPKLEWGTDKSTVLALREIAANLINEQSVNELATDNDEAALLLAGIEG
ncbi:DNA-directed RNA polymerase subunit omega [invertebrate metagenome]|uniref:DNA-directed RNA polymerase n=1 Tax=invertebrate metagenome TaxID=1711999 RepID=A0A2H9T973_9ZZZZ